MSFQPPPKLLTDLLVQLDGPSGHPPQAGKTSHHLDCRSRALVAVEAEYKAIASDSHQFMNPGGKQEAEAAQPAIMLLEILQVGPNHFDIEASGGLPGAGGAIVQSLGVGEKDHTPSRFEKAMTPV